MAAELTKQHREQALAWLDGIERTLSDMSAWADGDSPDRERASIALEDAARAVAAAGWLLQRDPARVAGLVHRRTLTSLPPAPPG